MASEAESIRPVTVETIGTAGGDSRTRAISAANGSRTGSIIREWKAWDVTRRLFATPAAARRASSASTAAFSPETTTSAGALTAARSRRSPRYGLTSVSESRTASIAPAGRALHEPAPCRDETERVLEGKDARAAGGDELAHAVAREGDGPDAPRLPQLREGPRHREDRGLGEPRARQSLGGAGPRAEDRGPEVRPEERLEERRAAVERGPEDGLGLVELGAHPRRLRPLPGEQERRAARGSGDGGARQAARVASAEDRARGGRVPCDGNAAAVERAATRLERARDVAGVGLGMRLEVSREVPRRGLEGSVRPGGEDEEVLRAGARGGRRRRRLLEDDVRVRPADAERADAGEARLRPTPTGGRARSRRTGWRRSRCAGSAP